MKKQKGRKRENGVTLAELAIVMLVATILISAVWGAASAVYERNQIHVAIQDVNMIAEKVFGAFTGFTGAKEPNSAETMQFFPAGDQTTPWNGKYELVFRTDSGNIDKGFAVVVGLHDQTSKDISRKACVELVTRIQGTGEKGTPDGGDPIPSDLPPLFPAQGLTPTNVYVKGAGAWKDVTGESISNIVGEINNGCKGAAFFFRL